MQAQGIAQEEWQAWFAGIPAKKSVLIFDTCESGTLTGESRETELLARGAANDRLVQATGRTILTASSGDADASKATAATASSPTTCSKPWSVPTATATARIEVAELAAYVYAKVTALSVQVFQGTAGAADAHHLELRAGETDAGAGRKRPRHRHSGQADPQDRRGDRTSRVPALGARRVRKLDASTPVTLVNSAAGWTLVARDTKVLG